MSGDTIYCGDVCNHTGPCRRPPVAGSGTHCPHGLDLRVYPRCYLCKPLESGVAAGCTCPVFWHGTVRPLCLLHNPSSVTYTWPTST